MDSQNDEGGGAPFPLRKTTEFGGFLVQRIDNSQRFIKGYRIVNDKTIKC